MWVRLGNWAIYLLNFTLVSCMGMLLAFPLAIITHIDRMPG